MRTLVLVALCLCQQIAYSQIERDSTRQNVKPTQTIRVDSSKGAQKADIQIDSLAKRPIPSTSLLQTSTTNNRDFISRHGSWLFPAIATILQAIILVWGGSW